MPVPHDQIHGTGNKYNSSWGLSLLQYIKSEDSALSYGVLPDPDAQ